MKIEIYNIEWDTSDFTEEEELASGVCVPDLPSTEEFNVDPVSLVDYDACELIEEYLANKWEHTVHGYNYNIVED